MLGVLNFLNEIRFPSYALQVEVISDLLLSRDLSFSFQMLTFSSEHRLLFLILCFVNA